MNHTTWCETASSSPSSAHSSADWSWKPCWKARVSATPSRGLAPWQERRAKQMLAYPWFQRKEWQKEMQHMLKRGVKLEIEALSSKGISFISEEYLPRKLRNKEYLS